MLNAESASVTEAERSGFRPPAAVRFHPLQLPAQAGTIRAGILSPSSWETGRDDPKTGAPSLWRGCERRMGRIRSASVVGTGGCREFRIRICGEAGTARTPCLPSAYVEKPGKGRWSAGRVVTLVWRETGWAGDHGRPPRAGRGLEWRSAPHGVGQRTGAFRARSALRQNFWTDSSQFHDAEGIAGGEKCRLGRKDGIGCVLVWPGACIHALVPWSSFRGMERGSSAGRLASCQAGADENGESRGVKCQSMR